MLVCDSEYVHLWQLDLAGQSVPTRTMRIKSQNSQCVSFVFPASMHASHAQDNAWCCAWGCADGRVHFYDATSQQHALYIPSQPLHVSPVGKARDANVVSIKGIVQVGFVFSHLVICGDERGSLSLIEFGHGTSPRMVQSIGIHHGNRFVFIHVLFCLHFINEEYRITSIDAGKQGTVVVGDESGTVSVWTTLPSPPYLQLVDLVDFSHLITSPSSTHVITTIARVPPPATSSQTTNTFLAHPTSILVAAKLQTLVATCAYDYHSKKVTFAFPTLVLGDDLRNSPLSDVAILQTSETVGSDVILQPVLAVGGMLLTPHNPMSSAPTTHFTLSGFGKVPKGVRLTSDGGAVVGFTNNQILLWKLRN